VELEKAKIKGEEVEGLRRVEGLRMEVDGRSEKAKV